MCLLFLLVGDKGRPSIICNNRDEYYHRSTQRGVFSNSNSNHSYSPKDNEAGGTWLSIDNLNKNNDMRYAIVLNYHSWRVFRDEEYEIPLNREELPQVFQYFLPKLLFNNDNKNDNSEDKRSRGLLIKDFMSEEAKASNITARNYAAHIFSTRNQYRPFNLIVNDSTGTYYVSSYPLQREPERLIAGEIYGLTNGPMYCRWEKVDRGRELIEQVLLNFSYDSNNNSDLIKDTFYCYLPLTTAKSYAPQIAESLLSVMEDDTPLKDPTVKLSAYVISEPCPLQKLSSIFVKPVHLIRKHPIPVKLIWLLYIILALVLFIIKQIVILVMFFSRGKAGGKKTSTVAAYKNTITRTIRKVLEIIRNAGIVATTTDVSSKGCSSNQSNSNNYYTAIGSKYWIVSIKRIIGRIMTCISGTMVFKRLVVMFNWENIFQPDSDLFGTRTSTIIIYTPHNNNNNSSNSSYYIMERDIDVETMRPSTKIYRN